MNAFFYEICLLVARGRVELLCCGASLYSTNRSSGSLGPSSFLTTGNVFSLSSYGSNLTILALEHPSIYQLSTISSNILGLGTLSSPSLHVLVSSSSSFSSTSSSFMLVFLFAAATAAS